MKAAENTGERLFPWNFYSVAKEFIKENTVFLNLSGEFAMKLLENKYPPHKIAAVKGIDSEVEAALIKAGLKSFASLSEAENLGFSLITSRFEPFEISKAEAKLKKGGHLIAEETGYESYRSFTEAIGFDVKKIPVKPDFNLENRVSELKSSGFRVVYRAQSYEKVTFENCGELYDYGRSLVLFDEFDEIRALCSKAFEKSEKVTLTLHRFIYTAKKR